MYAFLVWEASAIAPGPQRESRRATVSNARSAINCSRNYLTPVKCTATRRCPSRRLTSLHIICRVVVSDRLVFQPLLIWTRTDCERFDAAYNIRWSEKSRDLFYLMLTPFSERKKENFNWKIAFISIKLIDVHRKVAVQQNNMRYHCMNWDFRPVESVSRLKKVENLYLLAQESRSFLETFSRFRYLRGMSFLSLRKSSSRNLVATHTSCIVHYLTTLKIEFTKITAFIELLNSLQHVTVIKWPLYPYRKKKKIKRERESLHYCFSSFRAVRHRAIISVSNISKK